MKLIIKLLLGVFPLFLVAACDSPQRHKVDGGAPVQKASATTHDFASSPLMARTDWLQGPFPNVSLPSILVVYIYDEANELVSLPAGKELAFFATMPSMGHPLDQPGFFEEVSPGVFINRSITFNMAGDWQMELWIQDTSGNIEDQLQWLEVF